MKTKLLVLLTTVFVFGCGSKRKVTDFKKHEVQITNEVKEASSDSTKSTQKDSSNTVTNTNEDWEESIKETTVYDSSGRKVSSTKETNRKGIKTTNKIESKENKKDSTNVKKESIELVTDSLYADEVSHIEAIPVRPKNPIWHYIGFGLLVAIILMVLIKIRK